MTQPAVTETRFRVMASGVQIILVDAPDDAADQAEQQLRQLEELWSRFIEDSDITRLNLYSGRPIAVSEQTILLLKTMTQAWRMTGGSYDPTVLPAMMHAGYTNSIEDPKQYTRMPKSHPNCRNRMDRVLLDKPANTAMLPLGMALDPGGIGKGLAADLVASELLRTGASGVLVSIGGDLAMLGTPPTSDGWHVFIEDPLDSSRDLARLGVSGGGVATTSTLTRRWVHDGIERHHVIDPRTGVESATNLVSVTVIAQCAWQAEAHATAGLIAGSYGCLSYAEAHQIELVGTDANGRTIATEGLSEARTASTVEVS
jgi:FAD:protein FMN transferase